MSRSLDSLHPFIHKKAEELISACPIKFTVFFTFRTFKEQEALYEIGRRTSGKVVTNAKPGQSYHNYGLALDFVPKGQDGAVLWENLDGFRAIGESAEDLGFEWGGRWPGFKDYPHLQMSFGFKWMDLLKFYENGGLPAVWSEVDQKVKEGWPLNQK